MGELLMNAQPMDSVRAELDHLKSAAGIFSLIRTLFEHFVVLPVFDGGDAGAHPRQAA